VLVAVSVSAISSASQVESAGTCCLEEDQATGQLLRKMTSPDCERPSSGSDQLASLNALSDISPPFGYFKPRCLVPDRYRNT